MYRAALDLCASFLDQLLSLRGSFEIDAALAAQFHYLDVRENLLYCVCCSLTIRFGCRLAQALSYSNLNALRQVAGLLFGWEASSFLQVFRLSLAGNWINETSCLHHSKKTVDIFILCTSMNLRNLSNEKLVNDEDNYSRIISSCVKAGQGIAEKHAEFRECCAVILSKAFFFFCFSTWR